MGTGAPDAVEAARLVLRLRTAGDQDPVYARLAELGPVHVMPWKAVVVSDHAVCRQVLLDGNCAALDAAWRDRITPGWRVSPSLVAFHSSLLTTNPPGHARLRGSLTAGLSPRAVAAMGPSVSKAVERGVDDVVRALAHGGGAELVSALSERLPGEILCAWAGLPGRDAPALARLARRWSAACELGPGPAQLADADLAHAQLRDYFTSRLRDRARTPGEDALSRWLLPAPDGGGLGIAAAATNAALLFLGAKDLAALTTTALHALLTDAPLAGLLRRNPPAAASVAEDLAHRRPPIAVLTRVAARDMLLGGVRVPAGRIVHALLRPAHRAVADPGRTLAFGAGRHYCPGAPLTRLFLRTLLPLVASRFPAVRLDPAPPRSVGVVFPHLRSLPVTVDR
ncbi:cytochrome P450 [Streptomyces sp. NPDC051567]|uniref:cytochrome P450 n=1 Tax=Streptomyces sp. NPDC051567 TaxID=3365660 RepID=UPI003790C275